MSRAAAIAWLAGPRRSRLSRMKDSRRRRFRQCIDVPWSHRIGGSRAIHHAATFSHFIDQSPLFYTPRCAWERYHREWQNAYGERRRRIRSKATAGSGPNRDSGTPSRQTIERRGRRCARPRCYTGRRVRGRIRRGSHSARATGVARRHSHGAPTVVGPG